MPASGVISLSNGFLRYLKTNPVRRRIAPLQLAGRIEDYLVKEFMQFVFRESKGARFCETNLGLRSEQKVDISIVRRGTGLHDTIEALIEAKYIRNGGRRSGPDFGKVDEIGSTISDLSRQLRLRPRDQHGKRRVKTRARTVRVYGLVFASYARKAGERDRKEEFFAQVLQVAEEHNLQYHDLPRPYLRKTYEDYPITVFGEKWRLTLRGGSGGGKRECSRWPSRLHDLERRHTSGGLLLSILSRAPQEQSYLSTN